MRVELEDAAMARAAGVEVEVVTKTHNPTMLAWRGPYETKHYYTEITTLDQLVAMLQDPEYKYHDGIVLRIGKQDWYDDPSEPQQVSVEFYDIEYRT